MSETKHTPGPWSISTDTECLEYASSRAVEEGVVKYAINSVEPFEYTIATVVCDVVDGDANARLIASAPDMLEALRKAVKQLEDMGSDGTASGATAAIAKATGEAS